MRAAVGLEVQTAAKTLRRIYVVPFCDEYLLRFTTGEGSMAFVDIETGAAVRSVPAREVDDLFADGSFGTAEAHLAAHELNDRLMRIENILGLSPLGPHPVGMPALGWGLWIEEYTPPCE